MIRASINICSWQAPSTLDEALASVAAQKSLENTETVLVNNGFSPERATELQRRHPFIRIVEEPIAGLARARRVGFRASRGEFLVCIDDDNVLGNDFLPLLLDLIGRHPNLGCIRPAIVPRWEKRPPGWLQGYGLHCLSYTHLEPPVGEVPDGERIWPFPDFADWGRPPGGGMILHRSLAESYLAATGPRRLRLGRIGNSLGGSEDIDILDRLAFSQRDGAFAERLLVHHLISENRTRLPYLLKLNFQRNRDNAVCERMMLREKHPFATDTRRRHWEKILRLAGQWKRGEIDSTLLLLEMVRPAGFFYGWGKDALRGAFSRDE